MLASKQGKLFTCKTKQKKSDKEMCRTPLRTYQHCQVFHCEVFHIKCRLLKLVKSQGKNVYENFFTVHMHEQINRLLIGTGLYSSR